MSKVDLFYRWFYLRVMCVWSVVPDAQFVRVAPLSETDNPEDDKVYVFFTERAQEAEGAAGKVVYSRVARVCKVWDVYYTMGM